MFYRFLLILLFLCLTGCAHKKMVRDGDEHMARGEYQQALARYESALEKRPNSQTIQWKVEEARDLVFSEFARAIEDDIHNGNILGAIVGASHIEELTPEHPMLVRLHRRVGDATRQVAEERLQSEQFHQASMLYDALSERLPGQFDRLQDHRIHLNSEWAQNLRGRATAAHADGKKAEALLYWAKVNDLTGDMDAFENAQGLFGQLMDTWTYEISVTSEGLHAERGARRVDPRPLEMATLTLRASSSPHARVLLRSGDPFVSVSTHPREVSQSYQSGTRLVDNHAYHNRLRELENEERRLLSIQQDIVRHERHLTNYQNQLSRNEPGTSSYDSALRRVQNARSRVDRSRQDEVDQRYRIQQAQEALRREPPSIEEPVYSNYYYTITKHQKAATIEVAVEIEHLDGRPPLQLAETLRVTAESDAWDAHNTIGLRSQRPELPDDAMMLEHLEEQVAGYLTSSLQRSFDDWRRQFLRQELDGRIRFLLVWPQAVEPRVLEEIAARSGIYDAQRLLLALF